MRSPGTGTRPEGRSRCASASGATGPSSTVGRTPQFITAGSATPSGVTTSAAWTPKAGRSSGDHGRFKVGRPSLRPSWRPGVTTPSAS